MRGRTWNWVWGSLPPFLTTPEFELTTNMVKKTLLSPDPRLPAYESWHPSPVIQRGSLGLAAGPPPSVGQ